MKKLVLLMIFGAMMFVFSGAQKANAIAVGEPGEALLVPYVLYSSVDSINTLVGITVPGWLGADSSPILAGAAAGGTSFATAPGASGVGGVLAAGLSPVPPGTAPAIHWFFFDDTSTHILDNTIPATADDFVPFDWAGIVVGAGAQAQCDGTTGYLVFSNVVATGGAAATFAMYGDAALVQGNWQSAAYIPVVPMADGADGGGALVAATNEVTYAAGIPANLSPLSAGIPMDDDSGAAGDIAGQHIDMRYFMDPALNGGTHLVFWTDINCTGAPVCCDRTAIPIEVYATDETHGSAAIDLSKELNVIDAVNIPWTSHTETDANGGPLTNQGFVWITIPELPTLCGNFDIAAADGPDSAAVAFSLIFFGTSANALQVQTALAHERGLW